MRLEFRRKETKKEREKRLSLDKGKKRRRKKKVKMLGFVVLFYRKKNLFLFFIYNFYFDNLIYKWIKQFENQ